MSVSSRVKARGTRAIPHFPGVSQGIPVMSISGPEIILPAKGMVAMGSLSNSVKKVLAVLGQSLVIHRVPGTHLVVSSTV